MKKDDEQVDEKISKSQPEDISNLKVVFYGTNSEVTPVDYRAYCEVVNNKEKKQKLEGFDPIYCDFVDFILRITHGIWEEKGIGIIYDTYHDSVVMHCGSVDIHGLNSTVSGTLQHLHAFPDRRLVGENVVWSHDPDGTYYSSHRIISSVTNLGDSNFGPATGKKAYFRTLVDCKVTKNRIVEEWLVRDNLSIVQQLGLDPVQVAKNMAKNWKSKSLELQPSLGLCENRTGQFLPEIKIKSHFTSGKFDVGKFILSMYEQVWNYRYFNKVSNYYTPTAVVNSVENRQLLGASQIQGFLISLFASLPNSRVTVERVTCNQISGNDCWDVSARWRVSGIHEGIGFFGAPSGKTLEVSGITQFKINNGKIVEEWLTFDGLDVLKQIYAETDKEDKE